MPPIDGDALGLVETHGLVAALEAADAMLKAADVRLLVREKTDPALITIQVVGEVASVRAAVDAGVAAAGRIGKVVGAHVIPRPDPSVWTVFGADRPSGGAPADLEGMTVQELRALARSTAGFPMGGRQIARASKQELIELLRPR